MIMTVTCRCRRRPWATKNPRCYRTVRVQYGTCEKCPFHHRGCTGATARTRAGASNAVALRADMLPAEMMLSRPRRTVVTGVSKLHPGFGADFVSRRPVAATPLLRGVGGYRWHAVDAIGELQEHRTASLQTTPRQPGSWKPMHFHRRVAVVDRRDRQKIGVLSSPPKSKSTISPK